jgi:hypothetical protein
MNDQPDPSLQPSLWEALRDRQKVIPSDLVVNALLDLKGQVEQLQSEQKPQDNKDHDMLQLVDSMLASITTVMSLNTLSSGQTARSIHSGLIDICNKLESLRSKLSQHS